MTSEVSESEYDESDVETRLGEALWLSSWIIR